MRPTQLVTAHPVDRVSRSAVCQALLLTSRRHIDLLRVTTSAC